MWPVIRGLCFPGPASRAGLAAAFLVVLLTCTGGRATAQVNSLSPGATRQLARAEQLIARGRGASALPILRRIARDPVDARVALAFARAGLPSEPDAVWATPDERRVALAREVLAMLDRVDTTLGTPEQGRSIALDRGRARGAAGELEEAIGDVAGLRARLAPEVAATLSWLATLAIARDRLDLAERALDAATIASSEDDAIARDLAAVCLARGAARRAVQVLERRVARSSSAHTSADPNRDVLRRELAAALLAAGDAQRALGLLAAIATSVDDARSHLDAARAALEAGDPTRARGSAELAAAAARTDPRSRAEAPLVLAEACLALRDDACARRAFTDALARDPSSTRAREGLRALDAPR